MPGTLATFQGYPCHSVRFRRTRGWTADTSEVLLFAADFPQGFEFVTPSPGDFGQLALRTRPPLDLAMLRALHRAPRPLPAQRRLEFAGTLALAEADGAGNEFVVEIDPLFCVSLETVRRNGDGSVAVVKVRLVDARYFYARGFLRRWSFNRTDPEGNYTRDSVKPDGQPFSLAEIARDAASSLFLTPTLAHYPPEWDQARAVVEFARFSSATAALLRLAQEHGTEELCLNLDGSVALPKPGEGRVGYAPGGRGSGNSAHFPPGLQLELRGSGQTRGIEATYPPDFVVVVGGLRVATVRMDDLDAVLVIDNEPFVLDEELVRQLTKGKYGLAWLNKFVLAPQAYQNDVAVDPRVIQLLREQAYRLWRIPGVERKVPFKPDPTPPRAGGPAPPSLSDAPLPSFEQAMAQQRRATASQPTRVRGPNAHLLPLRDRAETVAGRRLPVRVDTYRFASVHRAMAPPRELAALAGSQQRLRQLRRQIQSQAHQAAKPDPFHHLEAYFLFQDRYVSPQVLFALTGARTHEVSYEDFQNMVNRARLVDRIKEVSESLARQYERELAEQFRIEQEQGGISQSLFDLAKEVVAFEREVAESRDVLETPDEEARERAAELRDKVAARLREIDRQREEQRRRTQTGARRRLQEQTAVFVRNLPRRLDPNARVHSAELGIVQTSDLSGHVAQEGVPVAEATSFVPKSPLVYFGAVLRPRVDAPSGRPVTGAASPQSETQISQVLSDQESYYTAAFKRVARGRAESLELGAVPAGEGVPIDRPDLVELVPLESESNRGALDETAQAVAEGLFNRLEQIEAGKYSLARPWPVNCDGVVAGVEIAMRSQGKGFVTTILTGSAAPALEPLGRTRVRVRRGAPSDHAAREGLLP
jgi:hypothetical protein